MRHYSIIDRLVMNIDQGVRTLFSTANAERQTPGEEQASPELAEDQRRQVASLMRVNHAGEVAAQALYQGQALTARLPKVRDKMEQAADEEVDHLAWCEQRLQELASHTSYLNPIWYTGSFLVGALAGLVGDRWSLGFVAETERQVVKHLENHLQRLPAEDNKTRAILQQMQQDEQHHATIALDAGASELPKSVKELMKLMSKVMTTTAYYC